MTPESQLVFAVLGVPVAYAALSSGMLTLIVTPSNLVVNGALEDAQVGTPLVLITWWVSLAIAPLLLPW